MVYLFDASAMISLPPAVAGSRRATSHFSGRCPSPRTKYRCLRTSSEKKQHLLLPDAGNSKLLTPKLRTLLQGTTLLAVPMVIRNQVMGAVLRRTH